MQRASNIPQTPPLPPLLLLLLPPGCLPLSSPTISTRRDLRTFTHASAPWAGRSLRRRRVSVSALRTDAQRKKCEREFTQLVQQQQTWARTDAAAPPRLLCSPLSSLQLRWDLPLTDYTSSSAAVSSVNLPHTEALIWPSLTATNPAFLPWDAGILQTETTGGGHMELLQSVTQCAAEGERRPLHSAFKGPEARCPHSEVLCCSRRRGQMTAQSQRPSIHVRRSLHDPVAHVQQPHSGTQQVSALYWYSQVMRSGYTTKVRSQSSK